jgi:hypothetical protein
VFHILPSTDFVIRLIEIIQRQEVIYCSATQTIKSEMIVREIASIKNMVEKINGVHLKNR